MMTIIFGIIAAIVGSVLVGYSYGQRTMKGRRADKNLPVFGLEADQGPHYSSDLVTDQGIVRLAGPATDHERALAKAVDEKFLGGPGQRQPTIRDYLDISASMDFELSAEDSQFLVDYLRKPLTHAAKPKARAASA